MSRELMIVLIVLIGVLYAFFNNRQKINNELAKQKKTKEAEQQSGLASLTEKVDVLEKRVQVLEKIVTDEGYEIKKQFNKL